MNHKPKQLYKNIDVAIILKNKTYDEVVGSILESFVGAKIYYIDKLDSTEILSTQLLIICGDNTFLSSKELSDGLKLINHIELVLCTTQDIDVAVLSTAIKLKAFDLYKIPNPNYIKLFYSVISHLEKNIQHNIQFEYMSMISKYSDSMFMVHDNSSVLFANDTLLKVFDFKDFTSSSKLLDTKEFSSLMNAKGFGQKIFQFQSLAFENKNLLISHQWITSQRGLFHIIPLRNIDINNKEQVYSRVEFIELLKNAYVAHKNENEAIYVVMINIKNAKQIIELKGDEVYNEAGIALSKLILSSFDSAVAQWDRDIFVVLSSDISPDQLKDDLEKLYKKIDIELSIEGINIYVDSFIMYMTDTSIDKAISTIDELGCGQLISKDLDSIIYSKINFEQNATSSSEQALYYLEKSLLESPSVKVLNFYKGIRISTVAKLIKLGDGVLYIATEKMQGYAMKLEESVIIQSSSAPYDIKAHVKVVDIVKKIAILTDFKPVQTSANNRQYIRIQSEHRMHVNIIYDKKTASGIILDFSIKSMAIRLNATTVDFAIGDIVDLRYSIPIQRLDDEIISMSAKAKVQFIQDSKESVKVIFELILQEPYEGYMIEYIYSKQQSLIGEIKAIASRL